MSLCQKNYVETSAMFTYYIYILHSICYCCLIDCLLMDVFRFKSVLGSTIHSYFIFTHGKLSFFKRRPKYPAAGCGSETVSSHSQSFL